MKVLREAKENLPISFLTDFISKGWEEIGYLKADIEAISKSFSGTKKVEDLIQSLIDAYLVCIGQLESHIQDKDYIEFPEEALTESKKESLSEDIHLTVNAQNSYNSKINIGKAELEALEDMEETTEDELPEVVIDKKAFEFSDKDKKEDSEDFEYFVDFDEPDLSKPKLTDEELYGEK